VTTPVEIDAVQVVKDLIAERDRLRGQVAELQDQLTRLRGEADAAARELTALAAERDAYRRDVYALLPKEGASFTAEDVAEWERTGIPLEKFIHELDAIAHRGAADGAAG
jgi:uncharacterized coiled-coil DUF342 family protein